MTNRQPSLILLCASLLFGAVLGGCGGGASSNIVPPPSSPDFALNISPSSTTVNQGTTSAALQISVQALHGFSGDVQVTLSGMPAGVTPSPQPPFAISSGSSAMLMIGASSNAAVGNASIAVQGASGNLIHTKSIALTVQGAVASARVFTKAGFYKFILYDQKRQWLYLSNIDHLDIFDLNAGVFRSGILPPGGPPPNALIRQTALTPDGSKLLVADFGAQSVYIIDPDTRQEAA